MEKEIAHIGWNICPICKPLREARKAVEFSLELGELFDELKEIREQSDAR
jgi:hypothetical protein